MPSTSLYRKRRGLGSVDALQKEHEPPMALMAEVRMGRYQNVAFSLWKKNPSVQELQQLRRQYREIANEHPQSLGSLVLIQAIKNERVSEEVRTLAASMRTEFASHIVAEVQVIESGGIAGTMARLTLRAIRLLNPPVYPSEIMDNREPAIAWIAERARVSPDGLRAAVAQLESR